MIVTLKNDMNGTATRLQVMDLPLTLSETQMARVREEIGTVHGDQVGPDERPLLYTVDADGVITLVGRMYECRRCHRQGQALRTDRIWCSGKCRLQDRRARLKVEATI